MMESAPTGRPTHMMSFTDAVQNVLMNNYANWDGRASRSEYWWFAAFVFICELCLTLVPILFFIFVLAILFPYLAVSVRRLHDINRSGWWLLISFIPLVGLVLFVFMLLPSEKMANEYGPNPDTSSRPSPAMSNSLLPLRLMS